MVIQKSVTNNDSASAYVYQVNPQDQNVTSSSLDQYFYTTPPVPKSEKKPEAYVFNFNKGSAPTIYIQSKP
ncbi:unnamed protein product [Caenorhabditis brenneri]